MSMPYVIIGGGMSGLLAAHLLHERNLPFIGIEKEDRLGGRLNMGHHRFYESFSCRYLSQLFSNLEWDEVEELPHQRRKGEWEEAGPDEVEEEAFYLRSPFSHWALPNSRAVDCILDRIQKGFQLNRKIVQVNSLQKSLIFQDGQELTYEKIFWCADLGLLLKAWVGDKTQILKLLKHKESDRGGISLDLELDRALIPFKNTIVFPFRFKEWRLRALGTCRGLSNGHQQIHWIIFLDAEILEDHDEVAKCLRSFRREMEKEFPDLRTSLVSERIVYLDSLSGEVPLEVETLCILPDVFYLGPQLRKKNLPPFLRNLDLIIGNCAALERELSLDEEVAAK